MTSVLVVDDSPLINKLLAETLSTHGYDVWQAHDATQAYSHIQQNTPDLIILDVQLPDANGLEVCKIFRNHPRTRHVPIIMITGTASSTAEKVQGLRSGADDYILKPFELEEFLERVRAVLRRSEHRAPAAAHNAATPNKTNSPNLSEPIPVDEFPLAAAVYRALCAPSTLPAEPSHITLLFLVVLTLFLIVGVTLAPGTAAKPLIVSMLAMSLWGLLVSVLVVGASLTGITLRWQQGARLFSQAAMPLLVKWLSACVFSGWTTLSPFLFTLGPALLVKNPPPWMWRIDLFEIWTAGLLILLLRKRPGASLIKVLSVVAVIWALAIFAFLGLLRMGGGA